MSFDLEVPYVIKKDHYYPIVQLILKRENIRINVDALVDSGASISVFHGGIGEYLGISIEEGEKTTFQGIGGKIVGYMHEVTALLDKFEFSCKIVFSNELTTSLNILGRINFFNHFLVMFNENDRLTKLRWVPAH